MTGVAGVFDNFWCLPLTPPGVEVLDGRNLGPVNENVGVLGPIFPVVHDLLLCLDHLEGEVVVLAPHGQVSALLPIGCLVVVVDQAVVSSANLMMVLESCLAMQS